MGSGNRVELYAEKAVILTMDVRFKGTEIWIEDLATPPFLLFDFDRHCPPLQNVENCDNVFGSL